MKTKPFAITGATGQVGSKLAELLLADGHKVRAIARSRDQLAMLGSKGAEAHPGALDDIDFLTGVFDGVDGVFPIIPPNYTTDNLQQHQRSIADAESAAIKASGVKHVVMMSSVGAQHERGTGPIAGLHYFEEQLNALSDVDVVKLRGAFFMENFLMNIGLIASAGFNGTAIRPDLPMPMVATKDIAATAARHLSSADFRGKFVHYQLGPRDLTMVEATRILGAAIGKPDLRYVQVTYEDARRALIGAGLSPNVADKIVEMQRGFNEGLVRPTEARSERNTTPTTLEDWSKSFAAAYRAATSAASV